MRITFKLLLFVIVAFGAVRCGKKKDASDAKTDPYSADFSPAQGLGCVQGTVINGLTGQKLGLAKETGLGVFVLIRGVRHRASIVQNPEDGGDLEMAGEYFICNVPLDESYLIFAQFDGYLPFQSDVKVVSTTLSANSADIVKPDPMLLANIRVFPKGTEANDLQVTVVNDSKPIKGAAVSIEPGTTNAFDKTDFLIPSSSRLVPVPEMVTGEDGLVKVAKENLVLGASYKFRIVPPAGLNLKIAEGSFILGVTTVGENAKDHYNYTINLATAVQPLKLVSCSNREVPYDRDGRIVYVLNREVELVDLDDPIAAMSDPASYGGNNTLDSADLDVDADDNNDQSEQVKVECKGNTVTLTPKFSQDKKKPDAKLDPALFITYDAKSIKFRIKAGEVTDTQGPISLDKLMTEAECTSDVFFFPYKGIPKQ